VVATEVGGVPELVENGITGFLVPPRDPTALAEALQRLIADPGLRRRMGEAGRTKAYGSSPSTACSRRQSGCMRKSWKIREPKVLPPSCKPESSAKPVDGKGWGSQSGRRRCAKPAYQAGPARGLRAVGWRGRL